MQTDPEASRLVEDMHKIQQQIQFSQQSDVQPSEEQINMFNAAKNKMDTSLTIQAYARARGEFEELKKSVNSAIGEGTEPEGGSE